MVRGVKPDAIKTNSCGRIGRKRRLRQSAKNHLPLEDAAIRIGNVGGVGMTKMDDDTNRHSSEMVQ